MCNVELSLSRGEKKRKKRRKKKKKKKKKKKSKFNFEKRIFAGKKRTAVFPFKKRTKIRQKRTSWQVCSSWPLEGAMYITLVNFRGYPENFGFMQFSQNIDGFQTKTIHKAFTCNTYMYTTLSTKLIMRNFFFSLFTKTTHWLYYSTLCTE